MRGGENDLPEELCVLFARITDGNIVDCFTHIITNIANSSLLYEYTAKLAVGLFCKLFRKVLHL